MYKIKNRHFQGGGGSKSPLFHRMSLKGYVYILLLFTCHTKKIIVCAPAVCSDKIQYKIVGRVVYMCVMMGAPRIGRLVSCTVGFIILLQCSLRNQRYIF